MCAEGAVVGLCGQWGVTEFLPASLFLSAREESAQCCQ